MYLRVKNTVTILSYLWLYIVIDIRYSFSTIKTDNVSSNINTAASSCNVYTSSAGLPAWYHFTSTECFYGDLMSPTTIKPIWSSYNLSDFFPYFNQIWIFSTDCRKNLQYQIWRNTSSGICADTCEQTDGRTDGRAGRQAEMTRLTGAFHDYAKAAKMRYLSFYK
jgi:hypothetical protein